MLAGIEFTYNVNSKKISGWFNKRSEIIRFLFENSRVVSNFYEKINLKIFNLLTYLVGIILFGFLLLIPVTFVVYAITINSILGYILVFFLGPLPFIFYWAFLIGIIIFIISRYKVYKYSNDPKKRFPIVTDRILKYYYQFYNGFIELNKFLLALFVLYTFLYSLLSFFNNNVYYYSPQIVSAVITMLLSLFLLFSTRRESTDLEGVFFSKYIISEAAEVKIKITVKDSESIVKIVRIGSNLRVIDEEGFIEDIPYNKIDRISIEQDSRLYKFFHRKLLY